MFRVGDNAIGFDTHQWQSVREDVVSDVVPPDGQLVQVDWVAVLQSHLDRLEVSVHGHIHARDGSVHLRNRYFSVQLLPGIYSNLTWVPFFSSMVTVSWLSFIRKRTSFILIRLDLALKYKKG